MTALHISFFEIVRHAFAYPFAYFGFGRLFLRREYGWVGTGGDVEGFGIVGREFTLVCGTVRDVDGSDECGVGGSRWGTLDCGTWLVFKLGDCFFVLIIVFNASVNC